MKKLRIQDLTPNRHTITAKNLEGSHMKRVRVGTTFCFIAVAGLAFAANASAECTRETLQMLADTYVKAQTAGNATMLPLAAGASYAENDKVMEVGKGVLAGPLKVDFTR